MSQGTGEPLHGVAIYNPALLSKEELVTLFVARVPLLNLILDDLRRAGTADAAAHRLLIGQRGMGKTMLLRRIQYAIHDDPQLDSIWLPLVFPEEQYNVSRLADLYVNWLDALCDALEQRGESAKARALDAAIESLPLRSEEQRAEAALDLLAQPTHRLGKRLLLLIDNVDLILDRLSDDDWAIRDLLSQANWLTLIGASAQAIEATYEYDRAFYDFFEFHELGGLNLDEMKVVLTRLAEARGTTPQILSALEEPGRVEALHALTGGNPRTIVLLHEILATGQDGSVRTDLDRLLDEHTPLYKARFEALPKQAQQIVDALATHWDPATASMLAAATRLPTSVVSAQLDRLAKRGVVEKAPYFQPESKIGFQIAERFFNIWYLMRASRRIRCKLVWLVKFLGLLYGQDSLRQCARGHLQCALPSGSPDRLRQAEYGLALSQVIEDPPLRGALESTALRSLISDVATRQKVHELLDLEGADAALRPRVEAMESIAQCRAAVFAAKISTPGWDPEAFWGLLGGAPNLTLEQKALTAGLLETIRPELIVQLSAELRAERDQASSHLGVDLNSKQRRALLEGHMTSASDVEGAHVAARILSAPDLPALALLARFEDDPRDAHLDQAKEALASATCPPVWIRWAFAAAERGRPRKEVEWAAERAVELGKDRARDWSDLGVLRHEHLGLDDSAEVAYRKALEIDASCAAAWNNLGCLLKSNLGRPGEAEVAFRKAIEFDPSSAPAWAGLGSLLHAHLGRYDEAEVAYRKALELDPNSVAAWNNLGNLLKNHLGDYEGAEAAYRRAAEAEPLDSRPWHNLGFFLADRRGRHDEAEAAYRRAIELDPDGSASWNALGVILQDSANRQEEAEAAYRRASELDPESADAWTNIGHLLNGFPERHDEAEAAYRKSLELDPECARTWSNFGNLLQVYSDRLAEAEAAHRKALELDPCSAGIWSNMGNLLLLLSFPDRLAEAESAYRKALELDPDNAAAWNGLGAVLKHFSDRHGEAEVAFSKAIELDPDSDAAWSNFGILLHDSPHRRDEAEAAFRKAIELDPDSAGSWNNMGSLLRGYPDRHDEAEAAYRAAIELDSGCAPAWYNLGLLLKDSPGRLDEAEAAYRAAIEITPAEGTLYSNLASLLFELDRDPVEAEAAARKAVSLAPDSLHAKHTLATILVGKESWEEAAALAKHFLGEGSPEFHESVWRDLVVFFREAVRTGHAGDAKRLLDELGLRDRWRPLREALATVEAGTQKYLRRVAPEVRKPASQLLAELAPELPQ